LGERLDRTQEVAGSSPASSIKLPANGPLLSSAPGSAGTAFLVKAILLPKIGRGFARWTSRRVASGSFKPRAVSGRGRAHTNCARQRGGESPTPQQFWHGYDLSRLSFHGEHSRQLTSGIRRDWNCRDRCPDNAAACPNGDPSAVVAGPGSWLGDRPRRRRLACICAASRGEQTPRRSSSAPMLRTDLGGVERCGAVRVDATRYVPTRHSRSAPEQLPTPRTGAAVGHSRYAKPWFVTCRQAEDRPTPLANC
jgi:hypothetical protein